VTTFRLYLCPAAIYCFPFGVARYTNRDETTCHCADANVQDKAKQMTNKISFQGELGAYGHEACSKAVPNMEPLPCRTFEDTIDAVKTGKADMAMVPVENTTYGRVADIHRLLPESGLHIVGEAFVRVRIALMAMPGQSLSDIKHVSAHLVLLPQARSFLDTHGITSEPAADSAGAAAELAAAKTMGDGVLASEIAADIYDLEVLARDIEDHGHNTTRFLLMAPRWVVLRPTG